MRTLSLVSLVLGLSACSLYINDGSSSRGKPPDPAPDASGPAFDGGIDPPSDCGGYKPDAYLPFPDAAVSSDGGCESPPDADTIPPFDADYEPDAK